VPGIGVNHNHDVSKPIMKVLSTSLAIELRASMYLWSVRCTGMGVVWVGHVNPGKFFLSLIKNMIKSTFEC
jgi:hypothetical protein